MSSAERPGLVAARSPLRVALLSPCFWPEVRRGSERFAYELASGLLAAGHRPRIITSHRGAPASTVENGVPIRRNWRPPDGMFRRLGFEHYLTHAPLAYGSLRRAHADVAQALFVSEALAAARWSQRTARPSVYSYMGIPNVPGLAYPRGRWRLTELAVRGCSAVTVLSRAAAAALRETLGVEARIIPPGVDTSAFRPLAERAERPTVICAADATAPRKRVDLLVRAFRIVRRSEPAARLVLSRPTNPGAAGRLTSAYPEAEVLDLDDRAALARAYAEAWVSALPSTGEAFGLVLAEALACGTPIVASDAGGLPELVDRPEVGRIFEGDEPEGLAQALLEAFELASRPATREACRERAREFSRERFIELHLGLYAELLRR
jgi:glycosyltransferase involved in cell wall biosynthesis